MFEVFKIGFEKVKLFCLFVFILFNELSKNVFKTYADKSIVNLFEISVFISGVIHVENLLFIRIYCI